MKQLCYLLSLIVILLLTSCRMGEKERLFSNDIDSLLEARLDEYITENEYKTELERVRYQLEVKMDSATPPSLNKADVYFVICGSFKEHENAINYATNIINLGFKAYIMDHNDYKLVALASFSNFKEAEESAKMYRKLISPGIWVYRKK